MKKTLKQFKEDMQEYGLSIHKNVYISVTCDAGDESIGEYYGTEEDFYEAVKFNNKTIKSVQVIRVSKNTHIAIKVGGN